MTRERDLGQVNVIDEGFEGTTSLHVIKVPSGDFTCCVRNFHQNSKREHTKLGFPWLTDGTTTHC